MSFQNASTFSRENKVFYVLPSNCSLRLLEQWIKNNCVASFLVYSGNSARLKSVTLGRVIKQYPLYLYFVSVPLWHYFLAVTTLPLAVMNALFLSATWTRSRCWNLPEVQTQHRTTREYCIIVSSLCRRGSVRGALTRREYSRALLPLPGQRKLNVPGRRD